MPRESFTLNKHGHVVLSIVGFALKGASELGWLHDGGFRVSDLGAPCLTGGEYDASHLLVTGQEYEIAIVPCNEIPDDNARTVQAMHDLGVHEYGYTKSLAGAIPRIREVVPDEWMKEMGFWSILGLHDPLEGPDGYQRVLCTHYNLYGNWVSAFRANPSDLLSAGAGVAFFM